MFANRMNGIKESFIREILKVAADPSVISFAGGLPNPKFFPTNEIREASEKVLANDGSSVLQYNTTEGYPLLREFIAERYLIKKGLKVDPDDILITNGSQQAIDLVAKVFINEKDNLIIENPGYLGAIQAFSMYKPRFFPVTLRENGIDINELKEVLNKHKVKLYYAIPNFQNPSGVTYSKENRIEVANLLLEKPLIYVEDDPYGELRFMGEDLPSLKNYYPDNSILLGSFSKIIAPSFRLGWVYGNREIMKRINIAKQASDLHTSYFGQRVLYQYLIDNNIDTHIDTIKIAYKSQRNAMVTAIEKYFPKEVQYTKPEGGMFLWITMPQGNSSMNLFNETIKQKVAFVPGNPFYVDGNGNNTFRLNYSNVDEHRIKTGIKIIAETLNKKLILN